MPTILVMSNESTAHSSTVEVAEEHGATVTLAETVEPEQLASDHEAAELVERVGWALTDAKDVEESSGPSLESDSEESYLDPRRVEEDVYETLYGRRSNQVRV